MTSRLLFALALVPGPTGADDADAPSEIARWTRVYSATAADVGMELTGDAAAQLERHDKPLLQYANPVRGVNQHGTIHLWTERGRPAVVGSIWSRTSPNREGYRRVNFEWHSLASEPALARYEGDTIWEPTGDAVEWRPVPDVADPGPKRAVRLLQMRRIAARFDAEIELGESELRMLPRPLYRYPDRISERHPGLLDGAIFAYVMGTDPEFFVLLEARARHGGSHSWNVGIVRFTNSGLEVTYAGEPWWDCERFRAGPKDQPYFLRFNVTELPTDLAGTEFDPASSETKEEAR